MSYGFSDGTDDAVVACAGVDNVGTVDSRGVQRNDAIISILDPTSPGTELVRASVTSFDSDGFTLSLTTNNTAAYVFHYEAVGGTDITNVKVVNVNSGNIAGGAVTYTGAGFQPDFVSILHGSQSQTFNTISSSSSTQPWTIGIGFGTGSGANQRVISTSDVPGNTPAANQRCTFWHGTQILDSRPLGGGTPEYQGNMTGFTSDGVTINYGFTVSPTTIPYSFLYIKGGRWSVGNFTASNTTGNQDVTVAGIGAQPNAIQLFCVNSTVSSNVVRTGLCLTIGGADQALNEGYIMYGDTSTANTFCARLQRTDKIIRTVASTAATASSTATTGEADIASLSADGKFTINWTDAINYNLVYFCVAPQAASGTLLYFHAASSGVSGTLPNAEQSSITANLNAEGSQTTNRSMDTTIGTSQTSLAINTAASASAQNLYFTRFVSPIIAQTSIAANTWHYSIGVQESNAAANFPVTTSGAIRVNCYVWKPSNGTKYGTILDGSTNTDFTESTTSERCTTGTFTGAAVGSLTSGDAVIVVEVWAVVTQGGATTRTDTFFYDGTTAANATGLSTVSSCAAFLRTPEVITFGGGTTPLTQTSIHEYNIYKDIAQTSKQKYNIAKYILQNSIEKYNILVFVAILTSIQKYNLAKYLVQTNVQKYNIIKQILQASKQKYDIRQLILRPSIQKYDLRANVVRASIQKYAILKAIVQASIQKYDLRKNIVRASIQKYDLRKYLVSASVQKYDIRRLIAQASLQKYNILRTILQSSIQKYDIQAIATVLANTIHKYHLRRNISQELVQKYNQSQYVRAGKAKLVIHIPLYIYPFHWVPGNEWQQVSDLIAANPDVEFIIKINPNSGPDTSQNADFIAGLNILTAGSNPLHTKILGYVFTSYGARAIADVKTDIDRYDSFYGQYLRGIFLDEMENITGDESYYQEVTAYCHDRNFLSWGNPGTAVAESYVSGNTVDIFQISETDGYPSSSTISAATFNGTYPTSRFAIGIYNAATYNTTLLEDFATKVQYLFVTSDVSPNPYDTVSQYIDDLALHSRLLMGSRQKYNIAQRILQTSIQKYNILKTITQASLQKYNILKIVMQASLQKYHILNFVAVTASLQKYHLFRNIVQNSIQKYHVSAFVLRLSIQKYNIAKFIQPFSVQKYAIRQYTAALSKHKYNILQNIAQLSKHKYHVMVFTGISNSIQKYNIIKQILRSSIQKYHISKIILALSKHKYNIIQVGNVIAASIQKYHISQYIAATNKHKYHILIFLSQATIQKYNLLRNILQSSAQKYNILQNVTGASIQKYHLFKYIVATSIHKFDVFALFAVVAQTIQKYNIRTYVINSSKHKYDIQAIAELLVSLISKYNISQTISQQSKQKYNVLRLILIANIHKYSISEQLTILNRHKYDILANVEATTRHKYHVLIFAPVTTAIHKYQILQAAITQTIHKYNITGNVRANSIHRYTIGKKVRKFISMFGPGKLIEVNNAGRLLQDYIKQRWPT